MYRAAKIAKVSPEAIRKQTLKNPVPLFFKKLRDDSFMVDEDHQLFKMYCQSISIRKGTAGQEEQKFNKLLAAVVDSIKEKYNPGADEMTELLSDIDRRFRS